MRKLLAVAVLIIGMTAFPALAFAAESDGAGCWGSVTSQFAQSSTGAMGQHSSSFEEPRSGIGNVAYANTGQHQPGVLGQFLGGLLGISC